jgi:hypothetical protein
VTVQLTPYIRGKIRDGIKDAFNYEELAEAMGNADITLSNFTSEAAGLDANINALIDYIARRDLVYQALDAAITFIDSNKALNEAFSEYKRWSNSPNSQIVGGQDTSPTTWSASQKSDPTGRTAQSGSASGDRVFGPGLSSPAPPVDDTPEPMDLPAGIARSEWETVWTEVWGESWPTMLSDIRDRMWRRVARARRDAAGSATNVVANQSIRPSVISSRQIARPARQLPTSDQPTPAAGSEPEQEEQP